ncbi:MAG: methyltransferase domain-containing protein [Alphaproteobacteria bacterium]
MSNFIHVGSHFTVGPSWENFDASPTLRFEKIPVIGKLYTKNERRFPEQVKYGNIVKSTLCPPGTAEAVFASHMVEHASLSDFRTVLKHVHTMLKSGGCFRLVTPDLQIMIEKYVNSTDPLRGHTFIQESCMGVEEPDSRLTSRIRRVLGFAHHYWLFDEQSMRIELEQAGFTGIRRYHYGDSDIPEFAEIEDEGQFTGNLAMECFR